jgi:hypothetical protein
LPVIQLLGTDVQLESFEQRVVATLPGTTGIFHAVDLRLRAGEGVHVQQQELGQLRGRLALDGRRTIRALDDAQLAVLLPVLDILELAVRVVAGTNALRQLGQPMWVEVVGIADQVALDLLAVLGLYPIGQLFDRVHDQLRLFAGYLTGGLRGRDLRKHRGQRFTGHRPTRPERMRRLHPLVRLMRIQPQQATQKLCRAAYEYLARQRARLDLQHERMIGDRQPAPQPLLLAAVVQQHIIGQARLIQRVQPIENGVRASKLDQRVDLLE